MPRKTNRRQFMQTSAATGIGFWVAGGVKAQQSKSPNERIAFACVGIGGKGSSDSSDAHRRGDMVAVCDVDTKRLAGAVSKFTTDGKKPKDYTDFRKMLDEMGKSIDAVTVSTPDHTHAPAGLMAMRMGKHCFVQKPLTHSIYEARLMAQVAREKKLATQMGNQGTASGGLRKAAALMRAGAIGTVKEVHVWTNRPIWPQGGERPPKADPPPNLKWNEWISAAPYRDFHGSLHPFAWRGWWDFGTGALGDMACHEMNMAYMGLDLKDPTSVQATTSGHNKDSFPKSSVITYEFPANDWRPAVKMMWYDGGKRPDKELFGGHGPKGSSLIVGDKGLINGGQLIDGDQNMEVEYPKSPGHFDEWTQAIQGGKPAVSNFPDYAGPLAETVLLGNLAVWVADQGEGKKVEWDAKNVKCTNIPGLETLIKPTYRDGYTLDV